MTPERVAAAFDYQAKACAALGSPFMEQLCRLLATRTWPDTQTRARVFSWQGDLGPRAESVPLRIAGALHALYLRGACFQGVYPPASVTDDELWHHVGEAFVAQDGFILEWIKSAPQTNEVRRSAAIIPAAAVVAQHFALPMRTSELGASGGLNLNWDKYGLDLGAIVMGGTGVMRLQPDWDGPMPPNLRPKVVERAGVDLHPLQAQVPADALRLQAYLWPDQPDRMARTRATIAHADTVVVQSDAIDWLETRLPHVSDQVHFIYHTIAWQYFPQARQDKGRDLIKAAGGTATSDTPVAWFAMENDGGTKGAAMTLRMWPGDITLKLGRADFHGRWINWQYKG